MAPVVRAEPNGKQALLMFDSARSDLEENGWLPFIQKFEGFNLCVARQFALTFDGCRAKVDDVQLEIDEQFISHATGLPATGQRWSKNCKVEEVPWTLLFQSRRVTSCDKGLPVNMLKQRWHDLLMIIKQFITCEGRTGLFSYTTFVCLWCLWVTSSICPIICIEACLKCQRSTKETRLIVAFSLWAG
jgi:hypothetical protein